MELSNDSLLRIVCSMYFSVISSYNISRQHCTNWDKVRPQVNLHTQRHVHTRTNTHVHTYSHTHTHRHVHTHAHNNTHVPTHTHVHKQTHAHTHTHSHTRTHTDTRTPKIKPRLNEVTFNTSNAVSTISASIISELNHRKKYGITCFQ
jgi:hypothetical protein